MPNAASMKNGSSLAIFLWPCHLNTTACKKEYHHPYAFCQPAWQMQHVLCASSKYTEKMIYKASLCSDFWREGITHKKMYHLHIDQHIQSLQLGAFFFFSHFSSTEFEAKQNIFLSHWGSMVCDLHPPIRAVWPLSQGTHMLSRPCSTSSFPSLPQLDQQQEENQGNREACCPMPQTFPELTGKTTSYRLLLFPLPFSDYPVWLKGKINFPSDSFIQVVAPKKKVKIKNQDDHRFSFPDCNDNEPKTTAKQLISVHKNHQDDHGFTDHRFSLLNCNDSLLYVVLGSIRTEGKKKKKADHRFSFLQWNDNEPDYLQSTKICAKKPTKSIMDS